jgi:hypothetical protein
MKYSPLVLLVLTLTSALQAKIDLVTLPQRASVQLTIYNSADLTLARESRGLVLDQGSNKLQFSWENTLIDPTSLEMLPLAQADKIDVADLMFPPRVKNLGLWTLQSQFKGQVPVEISYLTSGLSWRAFYLATLSADETAMHLKGYVRVSNNSGEDYENAQVRLIVGKVHILDQVAELARRQYPYGRPGSREVESLRRLSEAEPELRLAKRAMAVSSSARGRARGEKAKKIEKQGLSEYYVYTIEGTETISNGWSKRLISFTAPAVPVESLYKYEQQRYGKGVVRFLSFKNDTAHKLGETPIPGGGLKVYASVDGAGHLAYVGQSSFKYIPVDEKVELNLGTVSDVVVKPVLMDTKTESFRFNSDKDIVGFDRIDTYAVELKNTKAIPVRMEFKRNMDSSYWDLDTQGEFGDYEKVDADTVKFVVRLKPHSQASFGYTVRTYLGTRKEDWRP